MRHLKFILINALTLIVGLGIMNGLIYQRRAEAARFENVPSVQITGLGNKTGQYLTAIYAVGTEPFLATSPSQVNIHHVKKIVEVPISSDTMTLPSVQVEKIGFYPSYNMVVLVISPQPNYSWVDADGTSPDGMTATPNHVATLIHAIQRSDLEIQPTTTPSPAPSPAPGSAPIVAPIFTVDLSK